MQLSIVGPVCGTNETAIPLGADRPPGRCGACLAVRPHRRDLVYSRSVQGSSSLSPKRIANRTLLQKKTTVQRRPSRNVSSSLIRSGLRQAGSNVTARTSPTAVSNRKRAAI